MFPIRSVRSSGIPGSWEESFLGIEIWDDMYSEAIHKIKIGAERQKGIQGATDESGKDAVMG